MVGSGARPAGVPLGADSLTWALGFSRISLLLAGRALLMQVAHPTVGAGVRDYSAFRSDPWGRFRNTVGSLTEQLLGGEAAAGEADRLRALHRTIVGTGFDGERYHALDPEAGVWVHLSNFDSVVASHRWLAAPLSDAATRRLYAEWRQVGLMLHLPDRDLPGDLDEARGYIDRMIVTRLGDNITVRSLLEAVTLRDVQPPSRVVPRPIWRLVRRPGGVLFHDLTVGTLPPELRRKLGLGWTPTQQRRLEWTTAVIRATSPLLPERAAQLPRGREARLAARQHAHRAEGASG